MSKTTPPPRVNILEVLPELATQTTTTIRLHPRRGDVPDLSASKIGGAFLWPSDEPWPTLPARRPEWYDQFPPQFVHWDVPEETPVGLVPVLQINAKDVPDFQFPPGKDLLQLFWYPLNSDEPPHRCVPKVFWRDIEAITRPLVEMPSSPPR